MIEEIRETLAGYNWFQWVLVVIWWIFGLTFLYLRLLQLKDYLRLKFWS